MYEWEVVMSNGNSYLVESEHNRIENFIKAVFGDNISSNNAFGTIRIKSTNKDALINLKHLSEVIWVAR